MPAIGRFLIVVTFLEDALRIITQWNDQLLYLHDYRHSKSQSPHRTEHLAFVRPPAGDGTVETSLANRTPNSPQWYYPHLPHR